MSIERRLSELEEKVERLPSSKHEAQWDFSKLVADELRELLDMRDAIGPDRDTGRLTDHQLERLEALAKKATKQPER